jgi:hypothetical protein
MFIERLYIFEIDGQKIVEYCPAIYWIKSSPFFYQKSFFSERNMAFTKIFTLLEMSAIDKI